MVGAAWANDPEKYGESGAAAARACHVGRVKVLPWISRMRVGGRGVATPPRKSFNSRKASNNRRWTGGSVMNLAESGLIWNNNRIV